MTKNLFTLYQVQKKKLKERRSKLSDIKLKDHVHKFQNYFKNLQESKPKEDKQVKPSMRFASMEVVIGDRSNYKKKTKKTGVDNSFSNEINEENRKAEMEDDLTSESDADSTVSSEEEMMKFKKGARLTVRVKEVDYGLNETLKFTDDVYNYTICANMTRCVSPM